MMTESILYKKLALVLGKIKRVAEMGKSSLGYNFATDEAIYDMARDALASEGLAVLANLKSVEDVGEKRIRSTFVFTIVCGESGEKEESTWATEAWANDDKAINKTATVAMKYWLKTTLLIGTGKPEDDTDFGEQSRQEKQALSKQVQTPPPAKDNPNFAQPSAKNGGLTYEDGKEIVRIAKNVYGLTDSHQVCKILNVTKLSDFKQSKEAALKILEAAYTTVMGADEQPQDGNSKNEPPAGGEATQPALVSAPEPPPEPAPIDPPGSFRKQKPAGDLTSAPAIFATLREQAQKREQAGSTSKPNPATVQRLAQDMNIGEGKHVRHYVLEQTFGLGRSTKDLDTIGKVAVLSTWANGEDYPRHCEIIAQYMADQTAPASEPAAEAK